MISGYRLFEATNKDFFLHSPNHEIDLHTSKLCYNGEYETVVFLHAD